MPAAAPAAAGLSPGAVSRAARRGFATPEIFDFLDAEPRLDYVVAMARNAVLQRHAEPALLVAQAQSAASGQTAQVYADTRYRARTWDRDRRVVIKAEVVRLGDREPRDNPRFVVTNLRQTPRFLYERIYCARGDIENRIKELLDGLQIDRTSCCRFWANQLRVLLTAAAYVLMQELRLRAARTACARAQVTWLRDRLLKLGGPVRFDDFHGSRRFRRGRARSQSSVRLGDETAYLSPSRINGAWSGSIHRTDHSRRVPGNGERAAARPLDTPSAPQPRVVWKSS